MVCDGPASGFACPEKGVAFPWGCEWGPVRCCVGTGAVAWRKRDGLPRSGTGRESWGVLGKGEGHRCASGRPESPGVVNQGVDLRGGSGGCALWKRQPACRTGCPPSGQGGRELCCRDNLSRGPGIGHDYEAKAAGASVERPWGRTSSHGCGSCHAGRSGKAGECADGGEEGVG